MLECTKIIANTYDTIVAVTGKEDYISDGKQLYKLSNVSILMQKVTGMGCALSSFIASFVAIEKNYYDATVAAVAIYGVIGQIAAKTSSGSGSFQQNFIDVLYNLNEEDFLNYLEISKC